MLLHGLLDTAHGWDALARTNRRPCLAFDLPGFGGSDLPVRPSLRAYADDVVHGIDALLPEGEFVLVGHSLGGGIAALVAERLPGRVAALVLLAPAGFGRIPLAEAISMPGVRNVAERILPVTLGSRRALNTAYRMMISGGLAAEPEVLQRVIDGRGQLTAAAVAATKAIVRGALSENGLAHRRAAYRGPVTVLWGDRDRLVPIGHLPAVARAFPQVDAQVWPGMAHHPQHERPAELSALIEHTCDVTMPAPPKERRARPRGPRAA